MNATSVRPIPVMSAIILRETPAGPRVLVAQRQLSAFLEPGKWEFPGGKLEPLEHPDACLAREIREELDLEISVGGIFDVASHVYETPKGPVHILLLFYLCSSETEQFKRVDVNDARWVSANELAAFDYAAADIATVAKLRAYLQSR